MKIEKYSPINIRNLKIPLFDYKNEGNSAVFQLSIPCMQVEIGIQGYSR